MVDTSDSAITPLLSGQENNIQSNYRSTDVYSPASSSETVDKVIPQNGNQSENGDPGETVHSKPREGARAEQEEDPRDANVCSQAQPNAITCPKCSTVYEVILKESDGSEYRDPGPQGENEPVNEPEEGENEQANEPEEATIPPRGTKPGSKWKLIVTAIFFVIILSWGITLSRFSLLITLTALPETNTSNITVTAIRTKVDHLIHVTSYFVQCFEQFILLHGVCLFLRYKFDDKDGSTCANTCCCCCYTTDGKDLEICKTVKDNIRATCMYCKGCDTDGYKRLKLTVIILSLILMSTVHFGLSMILPILQIVWKEDNVEFYCKHQKAATAYAVLAIFDYFDNFLMRTAMAYITLYVVCAWKKAEKDIVEDDAAAIEQKDTDDMIKTLVETYHSTGEKVNAVQNIFQGWFVVKWTVYFINISGHSILAAGILLGDNRRGDEYEKHQLIYLIVFLIYDFAAFIFLFICGSFMNHYHALYRKAQARILREKLPDSEDKCFKLMQGSDNLISEVPEYQFLPTVLWIDFPLNSPGYVLTLLLALIAVISNFLTQYKD